MPTVLITGAATGIGNLTAKVLARTGHRVYATMRAPRGPQHTRAHELLDFAVTQGIDIRVLELDVASQESADAAA
ncbi:SDR family NAD(P)-dependent oxidoreductase [Streptomyces bungoensis]|uniref:SDR family NAD(P)-dependent oxidoreductase n=1 Tax=Streptomyces bungoensis TaxID=285568 RepID=UPI003429ABD2